jgi:hypothetical protein
MFFAFHFGEEGDFQEFASSRLYVSMKLPCVGLGKRRVLRFSERPDKATPKRVFWILCENASLKDTGAIAKTYVT